MKNKIIPDRSTVLNKLTKEGNVISKYENYPLQIQEKTINNIQKYYDYKMVDRQKSRNSYFDTISKSSLSSVKLTQKFPVNEK